MFQHTLKIGQKVKIEPISEQEKEYYPWGWVEEMDKSLQYLHTLNKNTQIILETKNVTLLKKTYGHGTLEICQLSKTNVN